jgi:hypothetical protein
VEQEPVNEQNVQMEADQIVDPPQDTYIADLLGRRYMLL